MQVMCWVLVDGHVMGLAFREQQDRIHYAAMRRSRDLAIAIHRELARATDTIKNDR